MEYSIGKDWGSSSHNNYGGITLGSVKFVMDTSSPKSRNLGRSCRGTIYAEGLALDGEAA